jgi:ESS family glutamate:Na+ symporter
VAWSFAFLCTVLCVSFLIAAVLRANLRPLQAFHVPNAITAGFVGLGLMALVKAAVPELALGNETLGNVVYHLLAVGFIAIALKKRERYMSRTSLTTAFHLCLGYAVEGLTGFVLTLAFLYTVMPGIFPTFGMLFEIGFGQSSGQAYALGRQWETLGFADGGTVGLTFGAIGFLWGCFVGIPFLNWGLRKGYVKVADGTALRNRGFFPRGAPLAESARGTTHPDVVASGAFHLAVIGGIYLLDYVFIRFAASLLGKTGSAFAVQFGSILWAYHSFFATLFALLAAALLDRFDLRHILDDGTLTGISAASVDFLMAASIMAIELVVAARYLLPIAVISVVGGVLVMLFIVWLSRRTFADHVFERMLAIFGLLTGTAGTGLALLRVVDPDYRTPAAGDLILGSGFSLFLGFPLLLLINVPALNRTGPAYLLTASAIAGYIALLLGVMAILGLVGRKKAIDKKAIGA